MIGIYKITNIINKKIYVGSSNDVERRWKQHTRLLNNNKHHSIKLQCAWNKYKQDNFKFDIIEECDVNILHNREQYWIDTLDSFAKGYNCTALVDNIEYNYSNILNIDKKIKKEQRTEIYYNYFMELYNTYKDNILIIHKTILKKLLNKLYDWKTYNKVIQLILEYEEYFSSDYYIKILLDDYSIESNKSPVINYTYKFKNNTLYLYKIYKDGFNISDDEIKTYKY